MVTESGSMLREDYESASKTIIVTGGAGYIGSHMVVELLAQGYHTIVLDNLCNSSQESLVRAQKIVGCGQKTLKFFKVDLCDREALGKVLDQITTPVFGVIHFAGLKAVGDSVQKPLLYYENNLLGTINLLNLLADKLGHRTRLIFSSSATVYGDPRVIPMNELCETNPASPYGRTKLMIEQIIADAMKVNGGRAIILRYFNPVGAHPSGQIGEDPQGQPQNLMPFVAQVAVGRYPELAVFGSDYFTRDGTGIRDYIHVTDLVLGHLAALQKMDQLLPDGGCEIFNLGTGNGCSVLEMVEAFERMTGKHIPVRLAPRRAGDVAELIADVEKAERLLGWTAIRGVDDMCADLWRWQQSNPNGYKMRNDLI